MDDSDYLRLLTIQAEQANAFDEALKAYQGNYPQRDDITLLSFRFD